MKYITVLGDGMSDYPVPALDGRTPLRTAHKPNIDALARVSTMGMALTVPQGMKPGSDTANLSVMGYDPRVYYTGRSPLEAVSMGIHLEPTDIALRANLVSLGGEGDYDSKYMADYSSGELDTATAHELIAYLADKLSGEGFELYAGISYRHCLVIHNATVGTEFYPPHDISGKPIRGKLPTGRYGELLSRLQRDSYELLRNHPINVSRRERGLCEVSSLWFWGEGTTPSLPSFFDTYGLRGAVISAVDLVRGIGMCAGMRIIRVSGATGTLMTNWQGKAEAAIHTLLVDGDDYVYIHMEAPDECGHQGDAPGKVRAIESIDRYVVGPIVSALRTANTDFCMLVCPDHPTPIATRTHASDPVPYLLYRSNEHIDSGVDTYDEESCAAVSQGTVTGSELLSLMLRTR